MRSALTLACILFALICDSQSIEHDPLKYKVEQKRACNVMLVESGRGNKDSISEVKLAKYPVFEMDSSATLERVKKEMMEWVNLHMEHLGPNCNEDLRKFADRFDHGGPFIIHVDYDLGVNQNGLLSVQLISNKEPCCGISGLTNTTKCWNVDLHHGRDLELNDVIRPEKKKQFLALINKREKQGTLYPDTAGISNAFDIFLEQGKLKVFFREQWAGMKYYTEVELGYMEHQEIFQPEFLDRIEMECRHRDDIVEGRNIYTLVDKPPVYPGGPDALFELVRTELSYTDMFASPNTYVSFVVETDGWITNAKVIKSNSEKAKKEALRFLKRMDRWQAGRCRGKEVPVLFSMPIGTGN